MSLDELIGASRACADAPTAADRARVRAKLGERIRASSPPAASRKRLATTVLLAAALLAVGTASALEARRVLRADASEPSAAQRGGPHLVEGSVARAARLVRPSADSPVDAPEPARSPSVAPTPTPAKETRASAAASTASTTAAQSVADEMALVQRARAALRSGAAGEALAALDRYDAEHRRGTFAQESSGLRVLALCEAGRVGEARARGAAFLRAYPRSPLAVRVRASCAGDRGAAP